MQLLLPILYCMTVGLFLSAQPSSGNIVLIVTDDQDVALNGMTPLPKTRKLIADEGVTFMNAFCNTPVCCPSRSSMLTGLYPHVHGTTNNSMSGGCSSLSWQSNFETRTFATELHNNGYRTFFAGKYLNEYGRKAVGGLEHIPEGWDWWVGLNGNSIYYNYTLSINGTAKHFGDSETDYLTDVLKNYALDFLRQPHIINSSDGFLMAIHLPSPHAPFTPANKYLGYFENQTAPRTPNFNEPTSNKHWLLRMPPGQLPDETINNVDRIFRRRWETLLSVDDLVEAIVQQLEAVGKLEDTNIIFTSDHGYHLGQFSQPWDKRQPYETDIRVPFFIRGPTLPKKKVVEYPALLIDVAPTIIDLAGFVPSVPMDGQSLLPQMISDLTTFDRNFLIEYTGESSHEGNGLGGCWEDLNLFLCSESSACKCQDVKNNTYVCTRHLSNSINNLYCEFEDNENFVEFYDLSLDPYQLNNLDTSGKDAAEYKTTLECYKDKREEKKVHTFDKCMERNTV